MTLPLAGYRVLDLTWQGPGPYCSLALAQLGADVIVVDDGSVRGRGVGEGDRTAGTLERVGAYARRESRRIALDLKHPSGQEVVQRLVAWTDVLLEGFRPGVAERLHLGADALMAAHPRLVYCSISGYGQDGPYRSRAGHDANYLALAGLLGLTGPAIGPPVLPGTIVADLAAGGLPAALAVLAALLDRERTGAGRVIDVSMQEGVAALLAPVLALRSAGEPMSPSGTVLTGAAPWYGVYETADGRYVAVGAIEPWLFARLCSLLGHPEWAADQSDRHRWPALRDALASAFRSRELAGWQELFDDRDACVTPVLTVDEALDDPQLRHRDTFAVGPENAVHPRVIPRFSGETRHEIQAWWPLAGADADDVLVELGYTQPERAELRASRAVP